MVTNNSFQIDLIGANGAVLPNSTQVFTVGTNVTAGAQLMQYQPTAGPSHSIGLRVTNLGSANWTGDKIEVDIDEAGKLS